MSRSQRAKASDVAREAQVSTATVSYVLNETPGQSISAATAAKVLAAADSLGYVRNPAARSLALGRSGFVILDMSFFVTQESAYMAAAPIVDQLRDLRYEVFIAWWPAEPEGESGYERLTDFARVTTPEAVISITPLPDDVRARLSSVGVASVSSLMSSQEDLVPAIAAPVSTQVDYLVDRGHTHILYVASADPSLDFFVPLREAEGAQSAKARNVAWSALPRFSTVPELAQVIQAVMVEHPEATAIAAYNDDDALAALFALYVLGVKIPDQMAVIGIDNGRSTELAYPKLTSVAFNFDLSTLGREVIGDAIRPGGRLGLVEEEELRSSITPSLQVRDSA